MHRFVTAAAVTTCTTLALGALTVPGAQAATGPTITKVVVNAGRNIVVGPSAATTFTASVTGSDPSGVISTGLYLWYGSSPSQSKGQIDIVGETKCTVVSTTTTTCTFSLQVMADTRGYGNSVSNSLAGSWHVSAWAFSKNRVQTVDDTYTTVKIQRAARLTVNAAPEPVKKGRTVTVTGALSRANWDAHKYAGYAGQSVKLQFRTRSSTSYTTLRTVTTSSTGTLRALVTATADGYYRYSYAGNSVTPAVNATGDYVDVQ
ncbi:DUF5707 domain-containing protein [Streptomyces sp. NPDC005017]|uniref:DUF5707 domain-containing protein n=1 Tax=Streptomyces sp. NPDC005017 TaxID=3364706 RepID=UPI00369B2DDA